MAGIIHTIQEKFKGGKKEEDIKHDQYKGESHAQAQFVKPGREHGEHKPEHKEGLADKIKNKVPGGKKKKEKKTKGHGHKHDGSSSSSDSD